MSKPHSLSLTVIAVLSMAIVAGVVVAQSQPSPGARAGSGPVVALLDVGYIIKNHARFNEMVNAYKSELERTEAEARTEKEAVVRLGERLREYRSGSPDYVSLESEIAKRQADFTAKFQLKKRDFARKEAKIWIDVYKEISDAADFYVQQRGIDMVLRFNGNPVDPEQLESVQEYMSRQVISYRRELDITPAVLEDINRRGAIRDSPNSTPR
jgi:Skp family chaperone for outer membrane proteins